MIKNWKTIDPVEYFSNLEIPDDWDTLEEFVDWFINSKYPIIVPWDAQVRRTDDATTMCLFKKGQYQVEIYLIYPGYMIQPHEHPGVEVITMNMGGGKRGAVNDLGGSSIAGMLSSKLLDSQVHGGESETLFSNGYGLLSFEKWSKDIKMTSAAIHWKGPTAGPEHDKLIASYYPEAIVRPGYADITRATK